MMNAKSDAVGVTQQVAHFLGWLRETTVDPQQGIAALTNVDLYDSNMAQWNDIRN